MLTTEPVGEILNSCVSNFSDEELAIIYTSAKKTLEDAHERRFCHHDVSPDNIVINGRESNLAVTVIDWGLTQEYGQRIRELT